MKSRLLSYWYKIFSFKRDLAEIKNIVGKIKNVVSQHVYTNSGIESITWFFSSMSEIFDNDPLAPYIERLKRINHSEVQEIADILTIIRRHYINSGRCEYGMNRTEKGRSVSDSDIFLGSIFGLNTHTVSYWKETREEPKRDWGFPGMENMNCYDVVSQQAYQFIHSHVNRENGLPFWIQKFHIAMS